MNINQYNKGCQPFQQCNIVRGIPGPRGAAGEDGRASFQFSTNSEFFETTEDIVLGFNNFQPANFPIQDTFAILNASACSIVIPYNGKILDFEINVISEPQSPTGSNSVFTFRVLRLPAFNNTGTQSSITAIPTPYITLLTDSISLSGAGLRHASKLSLGSASVVAGDTICVHCSIQIPDPEELEQAVMAATLSYIASV